MKKIGLILLGLILCASLSQAAFDKKVTFPGKTQAAVTFDHGKHLKVEGMACKTCHPAIFAKMKAAANKITMADINKGKFCGVCHKEKGKAFAVTKETCAKCHVPVEKPKA
jgi:c(7)-type cytochrome triheme protein